MAKIKFQYQVTVWREATFNGDEEDVKALRVALTNGDIDEAIDIAIDKNGEFMTLFETEENVDGTLHL